MQDEYPGPERRSHKEPWHLDRRVIITVILTLLTQTAGLIYSAAQWARDVQQNKDDIIQDRKDITGIKESIARRDERQAILSEKVVRVEAIVENIRTTTDRIERKVDKK